MAKKQAEEGDDLLAGKGKKAPAGKKVKKVASAKKAAKGNGKAASAEEVDDLLDAKPAGKKGAAAKKSNGKSKTAGEKPKRQRAEDIAATDDVRNALLKCKKFTSYADIQEATGINIRQIRRTARVMRDEGVLELQKDGTVVLVKRA